MTDEKQKNRKINTSYLTASDLYLSIYSFTQDKYAFFITFCQLFFSLSKSLINQDRGADRGVKTLRLTDHRDTDFLLSQIPPK